ncbi:hypothetical protein ACIF9R_06030 [Streptomyces sp. NPDC086080]|uniref:hypothetical protein n=1 Tax=Streptomyces sp. NPDC086080 TaxID=3365748 RepID=UPI0037CFBF13
MSRPPRPEKILRTCTPFTGGPPISDADLDNVAGGHSVSFGIDAGAAVVADHGSFSVSVYVEADPFSVSAGLGGSVAHAGAVRTGML